MSMKQLWAPWRMEFLTDAKDQKLGCVFCTLPQENDDRKNLILYRGEKVFIIMNKYPYNNGHVMVIPKLHVGADGSASGRRLGGDGSDRKTCGESH